jgi:hypothetical protein
VVGNTQTCPRDHERETIQGKETKAKQVYTDALADIVLETFQDIIREDHYVYFAEGPSEDKAQLDGCRDTEREEGLLC